MLAGKRQMSCLLFSTLDQGERTPRGRIITQCAARVGITQREGAKEMAVRS